MQTQNPQITEEFTLEQKGFISWVKTHKKQLIAAGLSIAAIIAAILLLRNKDQIIKLWEQLTTQIATPSTKLSVPPATKSPASPIEPVASAVSRNYNAPKDPFPVNGFIRKLPAGQKASLQKIAEAEALGICLNDGETFVSPYVKNCAA